MTCTLTHDNLLQLAPRQTQTITAHHVWASTDHYVLPAGKQTLTNIFNPLNNHL